MPETGQGHSPGARSATRPRTLGVAVAILAAVWAVVGESLGPLAAQSLREGTGPVAAGLAKPEPPLTLYPRLPQERLLPGRQVLPLLPTNTVKWENLVQKRGYLSPVFLESIVNQEIRPRTLANELPRERIPRDRPPPADTPQRSVMATAPSHNAPAVDYAPAHQKIVDGFVPNPRRPLGW